MRQRAGRHLGRLGLVVLGASLIAGCADTNRVATLNRETSGATVATNLEKQLAVKGFPGARVVCKRTFVVNVGTTDTCLVTGAGTNRAVQFRFGNYAGAITLSSVKVS